TLTPRPTSTRTSTPSPSPTRTATPSPSPTRTATRTATPSPSPTRTVTPRPTLTRTVTPTRPPTAPPAPAPPELLDKAPEPILRVMPLYPERALKERVRGLVILNVLVSEEGVPLHVTVQKGAREDLTRAAMDAALDWRFEPARRNGKPVR